MKGGICTFGYVRVTRSELRVREYEAYQATYCGLCRSMGKCTGQCSRMTLSYDFVFLALTRLSLLGEEFGFDRKRCIAHPLRKRSYMKRNKTLDYCSGAAALLNYHKVRDDLSDEGGFKKLSAALLLPFVAHGRKKALRMGLSELDGKISDGLRRLSELEKENRASVDEPARIFGEILGDILSYGIEGDGARVAHTLGASVGKWIYIADALDDWSEDAEKGRYNPFILLYGKERPDEGELDGIKIALKNELCSAEGALDLIDFENSDIKNIVQNILFLGLPSKIDEIASEDSRSRSQSKGKGKGKNKNARKDKDK
ncbi:MAG: hypothetical protein IJ011_10215 [Clostridia bacterium]|nr:hypothetical protein [Clostridia bacterium]